jgi:phosphatidylglycerol lysyltransferase
VAWSAGAVGNAVSNTLGFHVITGAVARYRVYRTVGLGLADTARIISLSWAALGFGFLTTFGLALLFRRVSSVQSLLGGIGVLSILASLLYWLRRGPKTITILRFSIALPSAQVAALQMVIGALEMGAAIGALYILMPASGVSFVMFSLAYLGAVLIGIASHAPGGIGVFEATMVSIVGSQNKAEVLAALLLYRLIYNLLPFGIAVLALGGFELIRGKDQLDGG